MSADAGFLDVLLRQQQKYRDMAALVADQKLVLEGADLDALLGLVERKRALLADIETLETEFAPLKARWSELKAGLTPEELRTIDAALAETKRLLADIVRLEDEGRLLMERQRSSTAVEIKDLMVKRRARGAYGGPPAGGPRFIDGSK